MEKAETILVRLGFNDQIVTKEQADNGEYDTPESYTVGYEDEEGYECEEDGTYLDKSRHE